MRSNRGSSSFACVSSRILFAFVYLTNVAGGETHFPNARVRVAPRAGRLVLWPNVKDADPSTLDATLSHEACTVDAGVKYAVNFWLHRQPHGGGGLDRLRSARRPPRGQRA